MYSLENQIIILGLGQRDTHFYLSLRNTRTLVPHCFVGYRVPQETNRITRQ